MLRKRSQRLNRFTRIARFLVVMLAMLVGSWSCSKGDYSGKVETVTIGENPSETKALIYIAQERGLLATNGINVIFKNYDSGVAAANALVKGEVDLATCAEFVTVVSVLKKENIRVITCFSRLQNTYIVARSNKGISSIADLKGKRIGVTRQTASEFFLGRFLELHGMSIKQVTLVNVTPAQSVDALASGSVDAAAVFQPHANTIKKSWGLALSCGRHRADS